MADLFTTGQIARTLKERPARVEYIIRRERLECVERVGMTRLFSTVQVEAIKECLYSMRIQR